MSEIADTSNLEAARQKVAEAVRADSRPVVVVGPSGSGRQMLAKGLSEQGFVEVEPPALEDPEAPLHALLQAASKAGAQAMELAIQDGVSLEERARQVAASLVACHKPAVIFRLPASWRLADSEAEVDTPDHGIRLERARDVLRGLCANPELRTAFIVTSLAYIPSKLEHQEPIPLPRMRVRDELDLTGFGSYASAAHELHAWCVQQKANPSPLQFRVAVALKKLGALNEPTLDWLQHPGPGLQVLEGRLFAALRKHQRLALNAFRVALARRPLERSALLHVSGIDEEHAPLLTECLGYGREQVVMHERVRSVVIQLGNSRELHDDAQRIRPQAHHALAKEHAKLDGVPSVLKTPSVVDWMERVHHLAGSAELGTEEWQEMQLPCREFYWDRGRALSLAKQYAASAEVYRTCLKRFGSDDNYAQHYLGFNLDRAGLERQAAEDAFREAIRLVKPNVWWNTRLVTFLIEQVRFLDARHEWFQVVERVDPDGEKVKKNPWLALHCHRWVVMGWLDHAQLELAREVFDSIPPDIVQQDERLQSLEARLSDAEETRALGESVYPSSVPIAERWIGPRLVPETNAHGAKLRGWYPGRIIETSKDSVLLVFAVPAQEPAERRAKVRELRADDWRPAFGGPPQEAHGFVEIGSYTDDTLLIRPVAETRAPWEHDIDVDHELRYMRRWKAD